MVEQSVVAVRSVRKVGRSSRDRMRFRTVSQNEGDMAMLQSQQRLTDGDRANQEVRLNDRSDPGLEVGNQRSPSCWRTTAEEEWSSCTWTEDSLALHPTDCSSETGISMCVHIETRVKFQ